MNKNCFGPAHILLPDERIPLGQWACIACDQFTSDYAYWKQAEALTAGVPSALHLVLPEAYLGTAEAERRTAAIPAAMREYRETVLTRAVDGYVYVERTEQSGRVRQGLVGVVDLEAYSYEKGALPLVRPSENTVVERIPPRMAVRRAASLELPHVMMLADDAGQTLVEPVGAAKARLRPLYEGELMLGGGHIAGWAVEDPELLEQIDRAVAALESRAGFDAKYPQAAGSAPMALAVGDGNHSLATAKACWEALKPTLPPEQQKTHPARWCLAEVCNVHSPAIEIEPIHRVLFGTKEDTVLLALIAWSDLHGLGLHTGPGAQSFTIQGRQYRCGFHFDSPAEPLTVGTIEAFLADFLKSRPEVKVDYIHGEAAVEQLCAQKGAVGLLLPPFDKGDIFKGVVLGGVLPRKTFSMGHAEEKRYYLEARAIV